MRTESKILLAIIILTIIISSLFLFMAIKPVFDASNRCQANGYDGVRGSNPMECYKFSKEQKIAEGVGYSDEEAKE